MSDVKWKISRFNPERRVSSRRIESDLLNMIDRREARPRCQIILESLHALGRTFCECFYSAVIEILDVAHDLVLGGSTLRKEAKTHALHVAADEELARNFSGH